VHHVSDQAPNRERDSIRCHDLLTHMMLVETIDDESIKRGLLVHRCHDLITASERNM
jgi:hypothetical protein